MTDDTIITKTIPTITPEGDRTLVVHRIKKHASHPLDSLAVYGSMGFYIIIPILAGLYIGIWIDTRYGVKPIFTLVLLTLGTLAGLYNLIRTLKR